MTKPQKTLNLKQKNNQSFKKWTNKIINYLISVFTTTFKTHK